MDRIAVRTAMAVALLALGVGAPAPAGATAAPPDAVYLDDVHPGVGHERVVDLYLRALTKYGDPVEKLRAIDLDIRDDGREIRPREMTLEAVGDTTRGVTWALVVDAGPGFRGAPFEAAKTALASFLGALGPSDRVALVAYAGSARVLAPFETPRADVLARVEALEVDADPEPPVLYDAIHLATDEIRKGADLPRRSVLIVFSDGRDGGSSRTLDQLIQLSQGSETRSHILVFAIGLGRQGDEGLDVLRRLANSTGGEFFNAPSARSLQAFYTSIWRQITRSYVIRYPASMDGKSHTVSVSIGGHSDSQVAGYPLIERPRWHYAVPAAGILAIALAAGLVLRGRSPGRLVFVHGSRSGESVRLRRGTTRIGAVSDNDVVIDEVGVSRNHAEIRAHGKQVEIRDLRSTNGTAVNGMPVQTSPLASGDKIRIGASELVFER